MIQLGMMNLQTAVSLTTQQQSVVNHDNGPALVFAVAGAGKTTAMVHRIERLVREGVFSPEQILATSFGRANVQDLKAALTPFPHCRAVDARTLHSLGRDIIKQAQQLGHLRTLRLNQPRNSGASPEHQLLTQAIAAARHQNLPFKQELDGLDRQDFLDYVGQCKGNLLYANFRRVDLPTAAKKLAGQAPEPSDMLTWYLDLYRLFEEIRIKQGVVTFADMLLTGWEALVTFPDLLEKVQNHYKTVLVDEFQDINLVQSELLDLITQSHGNYMAIGDDDQTIYEWRGASPHFILNFPERYGADTYLISDNFRCPATPLVLANRVIIKNKQRKAKRLNLTRGFLGETAVSLHDDLNKMSYHIVRQIRSLHKKKRPLNDIAVLVRLNAQTPPIEQQLISHNIPYRVSKPFYERNEIKTLIQYCRIGWVERELLAGKRPLNATVTRHTFDEAWRNICNRPKRYISAKIRRQLHDAILRQETPIGGLLEQAAAQTPQKWLKESLSKMGNDISWLAQNLDKKAGRTLQTLDIRLDYQTFLRQSSGFVQTGEGRAISVATFIEYAKAHGSLLQFMQHLRQLAQDRVGQSDAKDAVTISTIHQAKGLEWPIVIVPQCNEETLPFLSDRVDDPAVKTAVLAEERRLFYVALTRTQENLYLHVLKKEKISRFLTESGYNMVLVDVSKIQKLLQKPPSKWDAADALLLVKQISAFHLQRYFEAWWRLPDGEKTEIAHTLQRFLLAAKQQQIWKLFELTEEHLMLWQAIAPLPKNGAPTDFPGLTKLKKKPKRERFRNPITKPEPPKPPPEPDIIMAGMWVRCDAGWGQIDEIADLVKRPLASTERSNTFLRYLVTLRPEQDAEPIEIDVSASRIVFSKAKKIYSCTKCNQFSAADQQTIANAHNDAAHDGLSPAFKPERKPEIRLTRLKFSVRTPPTTPTPF